MRQSQIAENNNKQVSVLRYPGGKTRAVDNIFQYNSLFSAKLDKSYF